MESHTEEMTTTVALIWTARFLLNSHRYLSAGSVSWRMAEPILKEDGDYFLGKFMTTGLWYAKRQPKTEAKLARFLSIIGQIGLQPKILMTGLENDTKIPGNRLGIHLSFIVFADPKS